MRNLIRSLAVVLLLLVSFRLAAEAPNQKAGFFLEIPAGFEDLGTGDGATKFAYSDPNGVMEFDILSYDEGRFSGIRELAEKSLGILKSEPEISYYEYQGRRAALAALGFALDGAAMLGFAIFIEGGSEERDYALLSYAPESMFEDYADFILSCLDSFSIDAVALRAPGPISQFTLAWPPMHEGERSVALPGGSKALLSWSEAELRQETDTGMREYKVLSAYADEPELGYEAWIRFYRMMYRESAARLDRLVLEASKGLPPDDPTEQARRVLTWVQLWSFERDPEGMDFVPPLTAALEGRGDCDARAVAAAIVLERLGIDAILMVSSEYGHALLGVDVPGGGKRFPFAGKEYLVGETTSKVGLGMIAADQADFSKWLGVPPRLSWRSPCLGRPRPPKTAPSSSSWTIIASSARASRTSTSRWKSSPRTWTCSPARASASSGWRTPSRAGSKA